jgi:putative phosphoesterase
MLIGVISDTHGLLRPEAVRALEGSERIVHAGDVGDPEILTELERIAPVSAVRGKVDRGVLAQTLPATEVVTVGAVDLYVLHILEDLDLDPAAAGFGAVIYGHSHRPSSTVRNGVLYLNPGSAGPRRFTLPVTVARLKVSGRRLEAGIVELVG